MDTTMAEDDDDTNKKSNSPPKNPPRPSQTSSHFPQEAISGTTLFEAEARRRDTLWDQGRGNLSTGCREIDENVLVGGGFERGCVVGVSAEDEHCGLVLGLQTLARCLLARQEIREDERKPRVLIITAAAMMTVLGELRAVLAGQITALGLETTGGGASAETGSFMRECLERVAISRVFDIIGLWEVLGELDQPPPPPHSQEVGERQEPPSSQQGSTADDGLQYAAMDEAMLMSMEEEKLEKTLAVLEDTSSSPLSDLPSGLPNSPFWEPPNTGPQQGDCLSVRTPPAQKEEIPDSQEEVDLLSSQLEPDKVSPRDSVKIVEPGLEDKLAGTADAFKDPEVSNIFNEIGGGGNTAAGQTTKEMKPAAIEKSPPEEPALEESAAVEKEESAHPDMILITHMSNLLHFLFIQRQRNTAHEIVQLVASHLRYISRSPEHGGPLIMVLNSTTSSGASAVVAPGDPAHEDYDEGRDDPVGLEDHEEPENPKIAHAHEPRLPSRPLDPTLCSIFDQPPLPVSNLSSLYAYDTPQHSRRRNKPSFGLIFSQMLDMHLLCTTLPKTKADAEALYAPTSAMKRVEYVQVVEVLLDEIGVWEGREKVVEEGPRRSREQNWGAVEVRQDRIGLKIVNAFERKDEEKPKEVILAAGFGGPRV